jgi:hypothetical protein
MILLALKGRSVEATPPPKDAEGDSTERRRTAVACTVEVFEDEAKALSPAALFHSVVYGAMT